MGPLDTFSTDELINLLKASADWVKSHPRRAKRPNRLPRHTLTRAHDVLGDMNEIEAELERRMKKRKSASRHRRIEDHVEGHDGHKAVA